MGLLRLLAMLFGLLAGLAVLGGAAAGYLIWHYSQGLPDYQELANYEPPVTSRMIAGDGLLVGEFARERRLFIPIDKIPPVVKQAFLSAEDKGFYEHSGIDPVAIARAAFENVGYALENRKLIGASTITQQVAKNFLLGNEVSIARKVREALVAIRMEQAFTKDHILELYLNEIFLGRRAYGVGAAALAYFGKALDELTLEEAAYLAALPKAPGNYHPTRFPERATARRNWVIGRMLEDGAISQEQAAAAMAVPLSTPGRGEEGEVPADFFVEEVRRQVVERYGEKALYEGGLWVRTSLDPRLQKLAEQTMKWGLAEFDRRHGYRGPVARIDLKDGFVEKLRAVTKPGGLAPWQLAVVLSMDATQARIGFEDGEEAVLPLSQMTWARPRIDRDRMGPPPRQPSDILKAGDVICVEQVTDEKTKQKVWALRQIPTVNGALVAMDPHTGRVLAVQGGWSFESQYNRATQAYRQPGSSFKPFVYAAALDNGFTPSTLVDDAPIALEQGPGLPLWRPENYSNDFLGPTTLRVGLEKSRNLMTVRIANTVGMEAVASYAERMGVVDNLQRVLSMSLGAGETTLLRITTAYSMFVNGGKKITPTLIDRVQDRRGQTIYRHDQRPCEGCTVPAWQNQAEPFVPDVRPQVLDSGTAYQVVSMLEGVVQRGTAARVAAVGKPLAGKTGTTNDTKDVWFVGFSPDLAVGIYVGFDDPRSLGEKETGGSVSAPIFKAFMEQALANTPAIPFRVPPGLHMVRVDARTGRPADESTGRYTILEAFKPGTEPGSDDGVVDGLSDLPTSPTMNDPAGTGGLY